METPKIILFDRKDGLFDMKTRKTVKKKKTRKKNLFLPLFFISLAILSLSIFAFFFRGKNSQKNSAEDFFFIQSPLNKTYDNGYISITVSCKSLCKWVKERIDDGDVSRISCGGMPCVAINPDNESFSTACRNCYSTNFTGVEFKEGTHKVTVRAANINETVAEKTVVFTVKPGKED